MMLLFLFFSWTHILMFQVLKCQLKEIPTVEAGYALSLLVWINFIWYIFNRHSTSVFFILWVEVCDWWLGILLEFSLWFLLTHFYGCHCDLIYHVYHRFVIKMKAKFSTQLFVPWLVSWENWDAYNM